MGIKEKKAEDRKVKKNARKRREKEKGHQRD